jgi:hypothetical protein
MVLHIQQISAPPGSAIRSPPCSRTFRGYATATLAEFAAVLDETRTVAGLSSSKSLVTPTKSHHSRCPGQ